MTWPYPGDSPNARIRRVAHAYRAALERYAPRACAEIDALMRRLGQQWVVPGVLTHEPEEWVTPAEAADILCCDVDAIRQMRRRGVLKGRQVGKRWQYQVRELEKAYARPRGRNGTVTDTMPGSGTRAPE